MSTTNLLENEALLDDKKNDKDYDAETGEVAGCQENQNDGYDNTSDEKENENKRDCVLI
ncbi:Transcription elongation factor spt6 [Ophidiomyces ophidiicola]|uniref:Transcription elongation factor spt6 n=1 Tax=Ophidiomyces ophidiicola TaxID=1387563 RepID=UPI0020C4213A|nr:Transcription elongation factor spt6 [Ophidiomyces ophidiicola]KAI1936667.1 Transcription elongation factor spt6 [Ophidiomyces ophidiicola]KAI2042613.1 Transcription elongation factor spt6 [Ophidiomyces ophidiicola]